MKIVAAAAVVAALLLGGVYSAFPMGGTGILFVVNRFTGSVTVCYASGECHSGPLPAAKPAS